VGEEYGDGVRSEDREQDEGLSSEREQHGDGLHSMVGVAEVQSQEVCKSSVDMCGTEKCEVSVSQLSSQFMSVGGEERCPDVEMRLPGCMWEWMQQKNVAMLNKSCECV
jgi:hypothetical protein